MPNDVRVVIGSIVRERQEALTSDVSRALAGRGNLPAPSWHECAQVLMRLFESTVEGLHADLHAANARELSRFAPPLSTREFIDAIHLSERTLLDELALDPRIGATSDVWPMVAHIVRRASLEILGSYADEIAGREVPVVVRDSLTTLISGPVFELAVSQEVQRAHRHQHSFAMLLFDIDDLSELNRSHGWGAGDRLLERLGILARRFFRTYDWVARYGDDAIGVLLPHTALDHATHVAAAFSASVAQRLVLKNHKTDTSITVTLSAAAVGTDLVQAELEAGAVLAEAEAAVMRAKINGGNRVESVALQPTSLTIIGTATILGVTPREVSHLVRDGRLRAVRRGRHFHIERADIDAYRRQTGSRRLFD